MQSLFPNKLKSGDEVRVIAPSKSMGIVSIENRKLALKDLFRRAFQFICHTKRV